MSEELRFSVPGDEEQLKALWKAVFGDTDEYIDRFFKTVYTPGTAAVLSLDGQIVSAAYILKAGDFVRDGRWSPCRVIYAHGTRPDLRRRGYGRRVLEAARDAAASGFCAVCPGTEPLFGYFGRFGFHDCFAAAEERLTDAGLPLAGSVTRVTVRGYAALREELLHGRTHIDFDVKLLEYLDAICRASGGGLYYIVTGGARCCAAVEVRDGAAFLSELIAPAEVRSDAALLAARCVRCRSLTLRTPPREGDRSRPFAMLSSPDAGSDFPLPWFGFSLDEQK